jgi:hypothetical protein
MSFNLYNNNLVNSYTTGTSKLINNVADFRIHYAEIGKQFCAQYYTLYDTNFSALSTLYHPNSCITFTGEECIGFNNYNNKVIYGGYYSFLHHNVEITVQPLGHNLLLISSNGLISYNGSIFKHRFTETIILQQMDNNQIFVINSVLNFIN